ncbi:MAG: DUF5667 domain-containing protein [Anaerolineales bacterium]
MNRYKFDLILEDCLSRMDRGESLQDVLDSYPLLNGHLEPLVRAALLGRRLPRPVPSKDGFRTGKNMLLAEMNNMRQANSSRQKRSSPASSRLAEGWLGSIARLFQLKSTASLAPVYRFVVIGLVLVLGGGFLTVNASASSLPGDPLYDLKLGLEQTQAFFTFDPEAKQELALEIEQERLSEVELLLAAGRQEEVEFGGVIEQKSESFLIIKGISVQIGPVTELKGDLEIGSVVDVAATTLEDGTLQASDISAAVGDLEDDEDKEKEDKVKDDKVKDKEDKEKDKEDKDKDK